MSKHQSLIRFIVLGFAIIAISALSVSAESSWGGNILGSIQEFFGASAASSNAPSLAESRVGVVPNTDDAAAAAAPALSNGKITFSSNRLLSIQKVFTTNADGTGVTCLMCAGATDPSGTGTADTSTGTTPAFSPDGSKIAFVRSGQIWVMKADGTSPTSTGVTGSNPQWSPDGSKLAYSFNINSTGAPNNEIFIMKADGSAQTNITNNPGNDVFPSWGAVVPNHPQGRIAFRSSTSADALVTNPAAPASIAARRWALSSWMVRTTTRVFGQAAPIDFDNQSIHPRGTQRRREDGQDDQTQQEQQENHRDANEPELRLSKR